MGLKQKKAKYVNTVPYGYAEVLDERCNQP